MKVTPETILGTWQSDLERTLAEIKRHLRPDHPKLHEFTLPERLIPLTVCYTRIRCFTPTGANRCAPAFGFWLVMNFRWSRKSKRRGSMTSRFGTSTFFRKIAIGSLWIWIGDLFTGNFSLKSAGHQQFKRQAASQLTVKWRLKTKILCG